eukprot:gene676-2107_t
MLKRRRPAPGPQASYGIDNLDEDDDIPMETNLQGKQKGSRTEFESDSNGSEEEPGSNDGDEDKDELAGDELAEHTGGLKDIPFKELERMRSDGSGVVGAAARKVSIKDIPFEELERMRSDGSGVVGAAARKASIKAREQEFHRLNRHRPSEASSKRPVPRFKQVMEGGKKETVDPRFASARPWAPPRKPEEDELFKKRYAFLYDEVLPGEKKRLKLKISKEKNPKFKAKLASELSTVDESLRSENLREKRSNVLKDIKTKERGEVAKGKKPYFLKKSEQKKMELVAQYKELSQKGGLEKFMEKRMKKNAAKDHRYVPSQRRPGA